MFLFINTSDAASITLALADDKGILLKKKTTRSPFRHSEKLLSGIDRLIGGRKNLSQLTGLIAVTGPGSFSGLRVGLTTANTMAFGLAIPIIGVSAGSPEEMIKKGIARLKKACPGNYLLPRYGRQPNITVKK